MYIPLYQGSLKPVNVQSFFIWRKGGERVGSCLHHVSEAKGFQPVLLFTRNGENTAIQYTAQRNTIYSTEKQISQGKSACVGGPDKQAQGYVNAGDTISPQRSLTGQSEKDRSPTE